MNVTLTVVLLIACLTNTVIRGQTSNCRSPAIDAHIKDVISKLAPESVLRRALERGDRGDCIHQPWMDRMKQYGIKQAGFLIKYSWHGKVVNFKVLAVTYSTEYYSDSTVIHDRRLLKRIRDDGLEQELREAILQKMKKSVFATWHPDQVEQGKFGESLVDDETLPTLGYIT